MNSSAVPAQKEDTLLISGGLMRRMRVLVPSLLPFVLCLPAACQEVISAHSGTVHFFEGAAFLDDQPLERKAAIFPSIKEGSTLRTEKGRAEVLLTPGVVLRLDENSAFRLASSSLTDTQIEFLHGSAIIDSMNASEAAPVVMTYQNCRIRFPKPGIYRIDSDTGVLQAYTGQAKVETPDGKTPAIDTTKLFFFDLGTVTNKFGEPNEDEFYDWARGRADSIAAENQLAAQGNADPDDSDSAAGIFNAPLPSYGTSPSYPGLGGYGLGGYAFGDPWLDPYFGFTAGGFAPYNVFPIFLLVRPRNWQSGSHWPHSPQTPVYTPTRAGTSLTPIRVPVFTPRPALSVPARPSIAAPRPSAPVTVARPAIMHR
jgi:hypothetical protein